MVALGFLIIPLGMCRYQGFPEFGDLFGKCFSDKESQPYIIFWLSYASIYVAFVVINEFRLCFQRRNAYEEINKT